MNFNSRYVRPALYSVGLISAVLIMVLAGYNRVGSLGVIRAEEWYGGLAIIFLYLALLPGPLYTTFPNFPGKDIFRAGRMALGLLTFFFSLLHAAVSFFFLLGGFRGLMFLSAQYIVYIILGLAALLILTAMAATSFGFFAEIIGRNWKLLHRFVYLAGLLIIVHVFLLGSHFISLSEPQAELFFYAVLFLLMLQSTRIYNYAFEHIPKYAGIIRVLMALLFFAAIIWFYVSGSQGHGPGIHSQHLLQLR